MSTRGRVVIADNDQVSAESLEKLLKDEGYAVERLKQGESLLALVKKAEPNLVLLATELSDTDPFQILDNLKEAEFARDIQVIFTASINDVESRLQGLEAGDDLIVKPYDQPEVLRRVERQVTISKARTALRESEAKFRSVMESAIDAIITGDTEGNILSWNRAAAALFGFTEKEVIGKPIELIIPNRYRQRHREGMNRVSSGGPSHVIGKTVELSALRKGGTEFPVELSLATWVLDDKRYYTGIIRDISERKQAEQKFKSVTESAIDAIISADHTGKIVSWNKAAMRILGFTEEEAIGQHLELIIPERFHEAHRNGMARYTATGEPHVIGSTVELFARTKSGKEIPIELSLSSWTVRDKRYYTGIIRDIEKRKKTEEAIRSSEQALREKTEELKRKNLVLKETLRKLNETQNQLIMQEKMASLGKLSAGMAHELNNPASAAQRGAARLGEMLSKWQFIQTRMGELNTDNEQSGKLRELNRLVEDRSREPAVLGTIARNDMEADLEEWLNESDMEEMEELVPSLVDIGCDRETLEEMSSTFNREQLLLIAEWLTFKHEVHRLVLEIGLSTDRIVDIVMALKTYTFLDQAPVQSVDVSQGLDNTLIILRNKLKKGVAVVREYSDDLPRIQAYAGELNQVWTNIIDNAVDAMGGKGILTIRARKEADWVVVEIEDNGPGIPEEIQSKVFDPFFTTKDPGSGTGLGLNISRNLIVQKHNGRISVRSQPGSTCFTVRLPIDSRPAE